MNVKVNTHLINWKYHIKYYISDSLHEKKITDSIIDERVKVVDESKIAFAIFRLAHLSILHFNNQVLK